jgi:diaminopimelate decarboxylase
MPKSSKRNSITKRGTVADPTQYTPSFEYVRDANSGEKSLRCERVEVEEIAARVGTPAYVYSHASIESAYTRLDGALGSLPHTICYAVKANSNLEILRLFARLGSGFDIVSGGELYRLQQAGVPGKRIVFSGVGKSREEIREALNYSVGPAKKSRGAREGILIFNVESEAELEILAAEAARKGAPAPAAIRVNPDVEAGGHPHISTGAHRHKFGVDWSEARRLYARHAHSPWIAWRGISAHIGSQILTLGPFRRALTKLAGYVRELGRDGIALRYFDFGGGMGVRYTDERPPDLAAYARAVAKIIRPLGCHLLLEPGRALVGPAGILLTRVLYLKRNHGKTFVVVDAAMNDFIRPALYGATHPVTRVTLQARGEEKMRDAAGAGKIGAADVVGPVCETGDFFLQDWPMDKVRAGDLLALWGTGAYGFVAASNYNSRPRPAEVLVEGNRFRVIRKRESRGDLLRGEG